MKNEIFEKKKTHNKSAWTGILATLITLSIPTVIEEALSTLMQYVDTAMVGRLGEQATAAVSVTTTITWLVNSIPGAISVGVLAMISKAMGSGEQELMKRISRQALLLTIGCGLVTGIISLVLSPFIPIWMGAEAEVQGPASAYFFIVSLPMIFRTARSILGAAIRATQNTKTPMLNSVGANGMNMILNLLFIYGLKMGVTGAAIASAISYTISGIMMFAAYRRSKLLRWNWRSLQVDVPVLRECCKISLPVLGTSVTSCMGYVVFAGLVSGMGTMIFAAHSIAVTAETIFYIPGYGLRTATSALVGASLGEGDRRKFETVGYLSVALTVGMMCLSGMLLYLSAYPLMCLFTFFCVKCWGLDLRAVWYCMIADNVCKAVLFVAPVITKKGRAGLFSQAQ